MIRKRFKDEAHEAKSRVISNPNKEDCAVKCELCQKEFNNADELKRHMEQVHPTDEADVPDMKDENPEVKRENDNSEVETPLPLR